MLKQSGQGQDAQKNKGFSSAQETNKNKKVISKLGKGLNFTLNADLSKNPESKKKWVFLFSFSQDV